MSFTFLTDGHTLHSMRRYLAQQTIQACRSRKTRCTLRLGRWSSVLLLVSLGFLLSAAAVNAAAERPAPPLAVANCEQPIRMMPLGDSVTKGSGTPFFTGYRQPLYTNLRGHGYDVEFVGSQINGGGTPLSFDLDHEGHSGRTADWLAARIDAFLDENPADVVLLHIGTNDLMDGDDPATAVGDVETLLRAINDWERRNNDILVVLARIINFAAPSSQVSQYNTLLAEMAQARIAAGDHIVLVDMENDTGLRYVENGVDWADPIHPSYAGYQKMSALWLTQLRSELSAPPCLPLQVTMETDTPVVNSGAAVTFRIALVNDSAEPVSGVTLFDSPAATCNRTIGTLAAGQRQEFSCVAQNVTTDATVFIRAQAESAGGDMTENAAMVHVTALPINDAPTVDLSGPEQVGSNASSRFVEDQGAVPIGAEDLSITDPNGSTQVAGAVLTIENLLDGPVEKLAVDLAGTNIQASYDQATGQLELRNSDTITNYQRVLRTATYENVSDNPTPTARRVEIYVQDTTTDEINRSVGSVDVVPRNDPPTMAGLQQLNVLRGTRTRIPASVLRAVDVDNVPADLQFTLESAPTHGELQLGDARLAVGDSFSQLDINNGQLYYAPDPVDSGATVVDDLVSFSVVDGAGGRVADAPLSIAIVAQQAFHLPVAARN